MNHASDCKFHQSADITLTFSTSQKPYYYQGLAKLDILVVLFAGAKLVQIQSGQP